MILDKNILLQLRKIYKLVGKAQYSKALSLSLKLYNQYPYSIEAKHTYATMLGDTADYVRSHESKKMKKQAINLLMELTKNLKGKPDSIKGAIRNEYYYHSGQFKKQFDLGVELVEKGDETFYFSQGVGAAWYSHDLLLRKQKKRSKDWSDKAIMAFDKYLKVEPHYYNSYVHLALAYALKGEFQRMEKCLAQAAKMSKKPSSYFEFEKIRRKRIELESYL